MRHVEAGVAHLGEQFLRRRRSGGEELDGAVQLALHGFGRRDHQRHDDRGTAQMRHAFVGQGVPDRLGPHLPQADMRADDGRHGPGEAPAVAVEHRQGPQIDRMFAHRGRQRIALRQQVGAPVVRDDAFRVAGGTRGVADRNRVPFVLRHQPGEVGVPRGEEGFVIERLVRRTRTIELRIVILDHQRFRICQRQCLAHERHEFAIDDEDFRKGVVELEGNGGGVEPDVDRVQHRSAHWHAVMAFQHGRRVRQHGGNRIAPADTKAGQRRRQLARATVELRIAAAQRAMDDCDVVGEHAGSAFKEGQRRQWLVVCRIAIEVSVVGVRHRRPHLSRHSGSRFLMNASMPSSASRASMFSTMTCEA